MTELSKQEATFIARVAYDVDAAHQRARGVQPKPFDELDEHDRDVLADQIAAYASTVVNPYVHAGLNVSETAVMSILVGRREFVVEIVTQKLEEVSAPVPAPEEPAEAAPNAKMTSRPASAKKSTLPPVPEVLQNSTVAMDSSLELKQEPS